MHADLIFVNGQVVTVDHQSRVVESVAILGERILAVGRTEELLELRGPRTRVVDVKGRGILPGLIDSHAHIASHGFRMTEVDCGYPGVRSIEDIKARIREAAGRTRPGEWVRAWGYNEEYLEERRYPTRADLDEAAPDHPVYLGRICYHIAVLNSRGLELSGVQEGTADPQGGRIGRDPSGRPNGVLFESAEKFGRRASAPSTEELREAMRVGAADFVKYGITSLHDAGSYGVQQLKILSDFNRTGDLLPRVYVIAYASGAEELFDVFSGAGMTTGFGDSRLRIGPVKRVTDGDATAATAGLRQPYEGRPDDSGFLYYYQEEMNDFFLRAHRAGFQLTAHAAGDAAIEMVLHAVDRALNDRPHPDPRPRIEHCAVLDHGLMGAIKELGVIPVPQPVMFYDFGDMFLREYGEERCRYLFPCRSLLGMGVPVAASSDVPVATMDPFMGMYEAMTRKSRSGQVLGAEECVTLEQAIRMYTVNGAFASFEEDVKGSLEPGKLADLVVLSRPVQGASAEDVRDTRVEMTVVGGEVVYDSGLL